MSTTGCAEPVWQQHLQDAGLQDAGREEASDDVRQGPVESRTVVLVGAGTRRVRRSWSCSTRRS